MSYCFPLYIYFCLYIKGEGEEIFRWGGGGGVSIQHSISVSTCITGTCNG